MDAGAYEDRLNRARITGQEQNFSVGVQLLSGQITPQQAGEAYSLVAEALIETLLDVVQAQFGGSLPPPAVIAMGKLGGRETTASSDVDLIVVYDVPPEAAPQASQHYARMTQRLISAISAPTAEGELYAVDMRLRPSGKAGPVAVRLDGFLVSAQRGVDLGASCADAGAAHRRAAGPSRTIARYYSRGSDIAARPAKAAADVREMRAMIEKEKGARDIWQTKNYNGGLIDVEFIAQFLQIVHAAEHPAHPRSDYSECAAQPDGGGPSERVRWRCSAPGGRALSGHRADPQALHGRRLRSRNRASRSRRPPASHDGRAGSGRLESRLRETYAEVAGLFVKLIV